MRKNIIWILGFMMVLSCGKEVASVEIDKEIILVRKIGHEIMRYAKDSTTSLKPVTQLESRNYLLEFQTEFAFVSDSIISIIHENLYPHDVSDYMVKIFSCDDESLVFSYFISPKESGDMVSCMGRNQEKDCYQVEIKFIEEAWHNGFENLFLVFLIPLIGGVVYFFTKKPKNPTNPQNPQVIEENKEYGTPIGSYVFDFEGQALVNNGSSKTLTYKESKILKVLSAKINEVVERDELQKQVWEEDGIVTGRSLDMFISKLRKKLKDEEGVEIKNIHGIGYKLVVSK